MIAPTPRRPMPPKRRHHIFSENCTGHNVAPCCICGVPIHRHNDKWIIEHKRALGLLGPDVNTNCGPAHVACALMKTATEDLPRIAKAKRQSEAGAKRKNHGRTLIGNQLRGRRLWPRQETGRLPGPNSPSYWIWNKGL